MNYRFFLFFFIFIISCEQQNKDIKFQSIKDYSNKGFALIYDEKLFKKKIVSKKIDERSLVIFNKNLEKNTLVKVTNLLNSRYLVATVGDMATYPYFYNSVLSTRIAKEIELNRSQPYVKIQSLSPNSTFIANKAQTFEEERVVADKAPVKGIMIQNIGIKNTSSEEKKDTKIDDFNYIIKIADLFFEDSAILLKKRLVEEFNINNIKIKKMSKNSYRVFTGPFEDLDSLKKEFIIIDKLEFENIELIKI